MAKRVKKRFAASTNGGHRPAASLKKAALPANKHAAAKACPH
jgi:hypothetical protein